MIDWYIAGMEAYEAGYPFPEMLIEELSGPEQAEFWKGWTAAAQRAQ